MPHHQRPLIDKSFKIPLAHAGKTNAEIYEAIRLGAEAHRRSVTTIVAMAGVFWLMFMFVLTFSDLLTRS